MEPDRHYADARLAAIYDACNPPTPDLSFYLDHAGTASTRVLDLGCGTGRLATALAARGHAVVGVDPAAAMLAVARHRAGADRVRWIQGHAQTVVAGGPFDLAVMYGHVFQVFLTDDDLRAVFTNVRRHLSLEGRLAFETRNPLVREWDAWNATGRANAWTCRVSARSTWSTR